VTEQPAPTRQQQQERQHGEQSQCGQAGVKRIRRRR
jgi:hypothetical protein